ncbi:MAG: hypothetical protein PHS97_01260 [Oscillospiraceae bacterium]|nr:hypothetical protein [Oscillospiraceae bacterium]
MKKRYALLAALSMILLLTACTNVHSSTTPPVTSSESQNPDIPNSTESAAPENSDVLLSDKYVDVARLAVLDIDMEDKYVFDDRTLALEDSIDNELERLVYQYYYDVTSAQFEDLMDLIGGNESLQVAMENEGENYCNGIYMSEYAIHELTTLTVEDLPTISQATKKDILGKIDTFGFTEYAVVQADVSLKHNEASLSQGPQLGDGRYMKYYLIATTTDVPQFKMYEVYWEDFFVA